MIGWVAGRIRVKIVLAYLVLSFVCVCGATAGEHRTEEGFRNIYEVEKPGLFPFLRWRWERLGKEVPAADSYNFPLAENDPAFLRSNNSETTLTWIGHATLLLQINGKNVLTDPHFSERASPVQWAGPRRVVRPGLSLEDLPLIDVVVISHDHYDSLDRQTILRLHARGGGAETRFFVPLGLKAWFQDLGISNVRELDWWETEAYKGLKITATPVQHWSKRGLFRRNTTLWAGWVIEAGDFRFLFAGDSGYSSQLFEEIGKRMGPFDLAAIPIGAYEPRWFMKRHHMNPEESVMVHLDVGSRKSVAMHWGTFVLTDEPLDEPPKVLAREMKKRNIPEDDFVVLKHGETLVIGEQGASVP